MFLRQASAGIALESSFDQDSLELPQYQTSQIIRSEADLKHQRERLSRDWFFSASAEENVEIGLGKLSLESGASSKKGPLVFDISFNYAQEIDMESINSRATDVGLRAEAAKTSLSTDSKQSDTAETAATPGKSRFLSWFGRG